MSLLLVTDSGRLLMVQSSTSHGRVYFSDPDTGILSTGKTLTQTYRQTYTENKTYFSGFTPSVQADSRLVCHSGQTFLLQNLDSGRKGMIVV